MAFVSVDARSNFMYYRQEAGGRGGGLTFHLFGNIRLKYSSVLFPSLF